MIDPQAIPPVEESEWLARYIMSQKHYRSDLTVKPDPFIPYKHRELSVTRHRDATDNEIWIVGQDVAEQQGKTLYGRTDIQVKDCLVDALSVIEKPLPNNPNHADIEGWPPDKSAQKAIAIKLAALVSNLKIPPANTTEG